MIRQLPRDEIEPLWSAWGLQHGAQALALSNQSTFSEGTPLQGWVWWDGAPRAGVMVRPADPHIDPTLRLAAPWSEAQGSGALRDLIAALIEQQPHEAVELDVAPLAPERREELQEGLAPLGFIFEELRELEFRLSDVPPLGRPLILEGWRLEEDRAFRGFVQSAEGASWGDRRWAFMKRAHGPFRPQFWMMARESLDLPPVGYALGSAPRGGLDGDVVLGGVGVAPEHRTSTEMVRRLLLSVLREWSALSPMGRVRASLSLQDPKLVAILRSIGFDVGRLRPVLRRLPG